MRRLHERACAAELLLLLLLAEELTADDVDSTVDGDLGELGGLCDRRHLTRAADVTLSFRWWLPREGRQGRQLQLYNGPVMCDYLFGSTRCTSRPLTPKLLQVTVQWNQAGVDPSLVKPLPFNISERIVGGQVAAPGQFPFQVGLWLSVGLNGRAFCGGSILTTRIVITAAHCTVSVETITVVAGAHVITAKEATQQVIVVDKFLAHGRFEVNSLSNDIALLRLHSPLSFNDRVQPLALPSSNQRNNSFWMSNVVASGWGRNASSIHTLSSSLLYVETRVVSNIYCKTHFFQASIIKETHICVSGWWLKGPCQGDSGGPLVLVDPVEKPILVGVTSFGTKIGCQMSWPSVFTRVTSYLDWIQAGISELT